MNPNGRGVDARDIPELEPHSGSWVVIRNSDGQAIGEFTCRKHLHRFNADQVRILTIAQYLGSLNVLSRS